MAPSEDRSKQDKKGKEKKPKEEKRRVPLAQEFQRRVATEMADSIRKMIAEEERAKEAVDTKIAALEASHSAELRRLKRKNERERRHREREKARQTASQSMSMPAHTGGQRAKLPSTKKGGAAPKRKPVQFEARKQWSFLPSIFQPHRPEDDHLLVEDDELEGFWIFRRRRKRRLLESVNLKQQLYDPLISSKKRRNVAAMMIQRAVRRKIIDPIVRERSARVIQKNFKIYKEYLMREKWMIMIRLEKKTRTEAERRAYEAQQKREKHRLTVAIETKKRMERQAMAAGAWDPREMRNKQREWTKKDIAVIVALHYTNGVPDDDEGWEIYQDEFPRKKRSDIEKMVNKLRFTGAINDLEQFSELSTEDLKRLVPSLDVDETA